MHVGCGTVGARVARKVWGCEGNMSRSKMAALAACASASLIALPALAQTAATPLEMVQSSSLPAASAVAAFYDNWHAQPIWFRNGADNPAIGELVSILQRAPFDGFADGPQLAAQVQAAAAQARSANPADRAAAERVLSTAWVEYVEALKRPTQGMIYAYQ